MKLSHGAVLTELEFVLDNRGIPTRSQGRSQKKKKKKKKKKEKRKLKLCPWQEINYARAVYQRVERREIAGDLYMPL